MSEKSSSSSSSSSGIGFAGLLTIVFITLKLLGKIDWSWVWVLSPLWISALLVALILGVIFGGVGIVAGGAYALELYDRRKRRGLRAARERAINVTPDKQRAIR